MISKPRKRDMGGTGCAPTADYGEVEAMKDCIAAEDGSVIVEMKYAEQVLLEELDAMEVRLVTCDSQEDLFV